MNYVPSVIFQRSQAGREEIKHKSHGLTQSERLVLIMVDGVTCYADMRAKLPALTDERFDRALRRLQEKELVLEVFMPVEGESAETLEPGVIDHFLRQDPLDPVTIIISDPEEELSASLALSGPVAPPPKRPASPDVPVPSDAASSAPAIVDEPPIPVLAEKESATLVVAMDAVHNALADSLAEEVRARQMHRIPRTESMERNTAVVSPSMEITTRKHMEWHWGYVLIALGCILIGTFAVANLTR